MNIIFILLLNHVNFEMIFEFIINGRDDRHHIGPHKDTADARCSPAYTPTALFALFALVALFAVTRATSSSWTASNGYPGTAWV